MTGAVAPRARPHRLDIGKEGLYLATFMAVFDIAVVYLALPSMERSIGASLADQVWIASAYGVTEAGFTLAAGTLGDLYGRKRVYVAGIVVFTLASIASGLAPTTLVLIIARFIQGIGGAIMMALPLAILVAQCKDRSETSSAIRTFATIAGLGAVAGPALGGVLINAFGWRAVFFVNVPISLFVLYAALARTTESPREPAMRLDVGGQVTSILTLLAFSFMAIEGNAYGWGSPVIVGAALVTVASAAAFVWIERHASAPMMRFSALHNPLLAAGFWFMLLMNIGFFTMYLIVSLFLQNVAGVDALVAGWYLLGNNGLFFLTNQFSGPLVERIGERAAIFVGMGCGTVALASLALFRTGSPPEFVLFPLVLSGFGWGIAFTPVNTLAMSLVPKSDDGLASGLLSIGRPLGAVFGTAVFGAVLVATMQHSVRRTIDALHVDTATAARIAEAVRHGGLWALSGTAPVYGLPLGTLRNAVAAGFITGAHIAGISVAIVLVGCIAYGVRVYTRPVAAGLTEPS
jgi:DHA2 family methylenomycin A resistance protein-like MFS transporter